MTQMTMSSSQRLWYQQPAANWEEALPIGNGRMGAWCSEVFTKSELI